MHRGLLIIILLSSLFTSFLHSPDARAEPTINNSNIRIEIVTKGLKLPTTMAFVGPNDILVLEKDKGTVQRIVNGKILPHPLLSANVSNGEGRGMLGIAITRINGHIFVFLSFLESDAGKPNDDIGQGKRPAGNRLYRYELVGQKLVNRKLLLDLPALSEPFHYGGVIAIGPDKNVYWVVGDNGLQNHFTKAQNIKKTQLLDGTGGILRMTFNGTSVGSGILGSEFPLNLYYGYGIRNSFGIAFDPLTGNLWETENGPNFGDEINLVKPGFNGGWAMVQGYVSKTVFDPALSADKTDNLSSSQGNNRILNHLVDFEGKGRYSDPKFEWNSPVVAPTAVAFLNSERLGTQYKNDMFIGDFNNGTIYHFKLNGNRTELTLNRPISKNTTHTHNGSCNIILSNTCMSDYTENTIFGEGFNGITDIKIGPDGYLYVVSHIGGTIFRIVPKDIKS
jgi:aldose sugar dehydrogenase